MDATEFALRRELATLKAKVDDLYEVLESLTGSSYESLDYLAERIQERRWLRQESNDQS